MIINNRASIDTVDPFIGSTFNIKTEHISNEIVKVTFDIGSAEIMTGEVHGNKFNLEGSTHNTTYSFSGRTKDDKIYGAMTIS